MPVWGEVELAWRLRGEGAAPWLAVTGTNGKTTTVQMLEAILRAEGLNALAVGNVGTPVLEAVMNPEPFDVLAVELSSYQLHWSSSISAQASAVLNVAPDHLDWHGGLDAYTADKGRIYHNTQLACVYNVQDPVTERLVEEADVIEGCRAIGFTLGIPAPGMIGLVDDAIADRAFIAGRLSSAAELGTIHDLAPAEGEVAGTPQRRQRARRRSARAGPRRRAESRARRPAIVQAGRPPHRRGGSHRRRQVGRRLQGHQHPRSAGVAAELRARRVGGWGTGQGRELRRPRDRDP